MDQGSEVLNLSMAESKASLGVPRGQRAPGSARWWRRSSKSVWFSVAVKATSVVLTMVGLAAIGAHSIAEGAGHPVALASAAVDGPAASGPAQQAALGNTWLGPVKAPADEAKTKAASAMSDFGVKALREASQPAPPSRGVSHSLGHPHAEPPAPAAGITPDGKVILNRASASELTRLPGVGEKRAQAIVRLRERLKRFRKPTDLLRVKGIGVRTLRKMLPHLVVDAPEAADEKE